VTPASSDLVEELRKRGVTDVDDSVLTRALYSSDASLYRVVPQVVARPRAGDDLEAVLDVARATGVPVTMRGAGTSIAGNAVGPGIVVDTVRHLNRVVAVDAEARIPTALYVMAATGVRHLPVVERGRCLGVLVETDLIRWLVGQVPPLTPAVTTTLRQLYRPAPQLPPDARVSDAARYMSVDVSDAVLVIDHGRLLGIVTATDLVRLLARRDMPRSP